MDWYKRLYLVQNLSGDRFWGILGVSQDSACSQKMRSEQIYALTSPLCLHSVERRSLKILQCDWLPALILCPPPWLSVLVLGHKCTFNPWPIRDHILANQRVEPTPVSLALGWTWPAGGNLQFFWDNAGMWYYGFPSASLSTFPLPHRGPESRTSLLLFHFLQPISSLPLKPDWVGFLWFCSSETSWGT